MIAQGDGEDSNEGHDRGHEEQIHEGKLLGVAEYETSDLGVSHTIAKLMPNL